MLGDADQALVAAARDVIRKRFAPDRHVVGCALRTKSGRVHVGVHLECHVGRITVCAEAVAIGRAATEGDSDIEAIVAVYQAAADDDCPAVVSPCGMCREMISDYAPDAKVIVPGVSEPELVSVASLLPRKYGKYAGDPRAR